MLLKSLSRALYSKNSNAPRAHKAGLYTCAGVCLVLYDEADLDLCARLTTRQKMVYLVIGKLRILYNSTRNIQYDFADFLPTPSTKSSKLWGIFYMLVNVIVVGRLLLDVIYLGLLNRNTLPKSAHGLIRPHLVLNLARPTQALLKCLKTGL